MKTEATVGTLAFLAIAALVGFSGPLREPGRGATSQRNRSERAERPHTKTEAPEKVSACGGLEAQLKEFLEVESVPLPEACSATVSASGNKSSAPKKVWELKFVVATLPDPLHTHLSYLFDQFTAVIQEAAQDERYDFDHAWLPWMDGDQGYSSLEDQDSANERKWLLEEQPGVILFREALDCGATSKAKPSTPKDEGQTPCPHPNQLRKKLVVLVVGEDATHGIHRQQFRNALAWVEQLRSFSSSARPAMGVLGPTFSGSLPSLAALLRETSPNTELTVESAPLPIFSGSVSGKESVEWFRSSLGENKEHQGGDRTAPSVIFHSFVESDDVILSRFCSYMKLEQTSFDAQRVAVISEDETAYGKYGTSGTMPQTEQSKDCSGAVRLYYPRDISALRGAYQAKGLFDGGSAQSGETQRTNLPSDLADPSNPGSRIHDSIQNYGGDQTPLNQEAFLLEMVAALRELHTRYILLRSSSALDQLFLTNFLRRMYPNGRIVIMGADLEFPRERGATALSGTMTLSTYPLFPLVRDWTEQTSRPASDRLFSADTPEATYIAFRLLLNEKKLNGGVYPPGRCHVVDSLETDVFVPEVACSQDPLPDYSVPRWMYSSLNRSLSRDEPFVYPGPPTWLSVIGGNQFWPLASLNEGQEDRLKDSSPASAEAPAPSGQEPGQVPEMPSGMKVFLLLLAALSFFHAWCCWAGSYTAKPSFRVFFATTGDKTQLWLMFVGSCCIGVLGIVAGWGCGIFDLSAYGLGFPWFALCLVGIVCATSCAAVYASIVNAGKLSGTQVLPKLQLVWLFLGVLAVFVVAFVVPIELVLEPRNRILTYWRCMHLASGVSPLMPLVSLLVGFYAWLWFALHGLALFGPDRPCLPTKTELVLKDTDGKDLDVLPMFSQEDVADEIEKDAMPLTRKMAIGIVPCLLLLVITSAMARGVPVRSLGAQVYSAILLLWLAVSGSLIVGGAWQLYALWAELRRLLSFLDRLPLRRTLAALRGFSWGTVWKMSGNVLEVRYKLISRQLESMNHTIAALIEFEKKLPDSDDARGIRQAIRDCLAALTAMHKAGVVFAKWYSENYCNSRAGDMKAFGTFQTTAATAGGTLLTQLLVPAWKRENKSLILVQQHDDGDKDNPCLAPPLAQNEHIRNAEEFVCLTYMGFIQNVLGRLRTVAMAMVALFIAATAALTTYPFDPRQVLSSVLIALFVGVGVVMIKVYAEMHRDATLSHVTNTRPGELGMEFWIKVVGFGLAPLIGLLTRIFPGITEFVFSWLQPSLSSLK